MGFHRLRDFKVSTWEEPQEKGFTFHPAVLKYATRLNKWSILLLIISDNVWALCMQNPDNFSNLLR